MSLIDKYNDTPIKTRLGAGNFTYKCVLDTSTIGVVKIEIFANNMEEAMYIASCHFGNILSWSYISNDIISLVIPPYYDGTCLLYL